MCETLPTHLLILLVPVLRHWSDQHLYNAERLEECVLPLPFSYLRYHNGSVIQLVHILNVFQNLV